MTDYKPQEDKEVDQWATEMLIDLERSNKVKENSLYFEKRSHLARWVVAGTASALINTGANFRLPGVNLNGIGLPGFPAPDIQTPPSPDLDNGDGLENGQRDVPISPLSPDAEKVYGIDSFNFPGPDSYFGQLPGVEDDTVSSIRGWAQGQIAEQMFGIENFNPFNKDHMAIFNDRWGGDAFAPSTNAEYNKAVEGLVDFVKRETIERTANPPFVEGNPDLMQHFIDPNAIHGSGKELVTYWKPKNIEDFLNDLLKPSISHSGILPHAA